MTFFSNSLQLSYNIPKSQLEFLRVGSRYGSQSVIYHCRNTAAAVVFKTHNNKEISASKILTDDCQVRTLLDLHDVVAPAQNLEILVPYVLVQCDGEK